MGCQEKVGATGKRKTVGWTKHREITYQFQLLVEQAWLGEIKCNLLCVYIYIFTNLGRKKRSIKIHREKNSVPQLSQDQLHSSTPHSSLATTTSYTKFSKEATGAVCSGGGVWLGGSVFSLLFLPSCCFLLLCHGLSMGCCPLSGWRGAWSGRQQGGNVSAVAELIYVLELCCLMSWQDLTRDRHHALLQSYSCGCACLHMERGFLLNWVLASSLPGKKSRNLHWEKLRPHLNHRVCRNFSMPCSHISSFSISGMSLEYVLVPFWSSCWQHSVWEGDTLIDLLMNDVTSVHSQARSLHLHLGASV